MALPKVNRTLPTKVGSVTLHIGGKVMPDGTIPEIDAAVEYTLTDDAGNVVGERRSHPLLPHMSGTRVNALSNLLNQIKDQLVAEVLAP